MTSMDKLTRKKKALKRLRDERFACVITLSQIEEYENVDWSEWAKQDYDAADFARRKLAVLHGYFNLLMRKKAVRDWINLA